jgi:hypothetical protein
MRGANDHLKGCQAEVTNGRGWVRRAYDADGMNGRDAGHVTTGLRGQVVAVEYHGSAPYTRLTVRFEDGSQTNGLYPQDLRLTRRGV